MTTREGSLEAPKRHPLNWKQADFYNEDQLLEEMGRVFDICHGCRRCVNLCTAFPKLFDLIDDGKTGELDGVEKQTFWKVVDRCYLCDMCFMTKCPYVPPHPWNIDFPHLMLRAKAVKYKKQGAPFRDKLLANTDTVGKLATIPVVVQMTNTLTKVPIARKLMESTLGIHAERKLPDYAPQKFRNYAQPNANFVEKKGARTPGKVAIFATCYISYNEPNIGHDLLQILAHNEILTCLVEQEVCCGMPQLELGNLEKVEEYKNKNIPVLAKLAQAGYAILSAVPSCTLMFKQELPLMFPDDEAVQAVAATMYDPFEYLMLRHQDQLLKTDFTRSLGKISYHIPCHLRVQNIGKKTRDLLQLIPNTQVTTIERCSGHDGTWGVKREYFSDSMKIGKPVFNQMTDPDPDYICSDCAIAARHIQQGMDNHRAQKLHPLTLLRLAYGESKSVLSEQSMAPQPSHENKKSMAKISRESLMTLEAYAKARQQFRSKVIEHKKNRLLALGEQVTLLFEDELTIRYQIQEMLRAEKIFDEEGILQELAAYNPLVPDGTNWKATMMIEYTDPEERAIKLTELIGIEDKVWVEVEGHEKIFAIADEDLDRENEVKTSSVHFLRFELNHAQIQALHRGSTLRIGVNHPGYNATTEAIENPIREALLSDLSLP